jgi:hypothetical protein
MALFKECVCHSSIFRLLNAPELLYKYPANFQIQATLSQLLIEETFEYNTIVKEGNVLTPTARSY